MGRLTASYDAGVGGSALVGDTIGAALGTMIEAQPDVDAVVSLHQGIRLSYGQLGDEVEAVARGLLAVGIETGDRVGIWAPTCVEWTLLQFACARDRSDPRQRQPRVPARTSSRTPSDTLACGCSSPARSFKTSDYLDDARGASVPSSPSSSWS